MSGWEFWVVAVIAAVLTGVGKGGLPMVGTLTVPVLSLVKGRRVRHVIARVVDRLFGFPADVEDLWKNAFCVATNYTTASEDVARRGPLDRAILASIAIPGALPPILRDGSAVAADVREIVGGAKQAWPIRNLIDAPAPATLKADSDPRGEAGRAR